MNIYEELRTIHWVSLFTVGYLVYFLLQPWFSPLRKIPGPWVARYTKWWIISKTGQGLRAKTIHDLHERYGKWVLIAPTEVSTRDPEAIVPIYGTTSKFRKTDFYTYQLRGIPELFTMSDQKEHANRRRLLANLFAMSTIKDYEPLILEKVQLCMDLIAIDPERKCNLYDWFHFLAMDIICELSCGTTFDMLRQGLQNKFIQDMYTSLEIEGIRYHFGWFNQFAAWAPFQWIRNSEAASKRLLSAGMQMVGDYKQNPEKKRAKDLLRKMIDSKDTNGQPLPEEALNIEATGFILAGSHTTSSTLTWIVWRLLKNRSSLNHLVAELDTALQGTHTSRPPSHRVLENLPYLNAVIKEGLRIDSAVPGSTPRYVPYTGATINDKYLPAGTIISIQAYSIHRDSSVFPESDAFIPERWLDNGETPEMRRMFIPFGADGPRKCIGINLAFMELRVILASLLRRFELSLDHEHNDLDMEMHELFLASPQAQKLNVFVKERDTTKEAA